MLRSSKRLALLIFLGVLGCGYHLTGTTTHVPEGVGSVAIPTFTNRTFEPGIEIMFTQAFLKEFLGDKRVKVVDRSEADTILEGTIKSFRIYSVSYDRSGYASEYRTDVVVDVVLKRRTGEIVWKEDNLTEMRWYRTTANPVTTQTSMNIAITDLGKVVADRVRSRFFYNF
jgi:outer membrane lipopolysaccharide assembly protein LptE/RlpB